MKIKIFRAHGVQQVNELENEINSWIESENLAPDQIIKTEMATTTFGDASQADQVLVISVWYVSI